MNNISRVLILLVCVYCTSLINAQDIVYPELAKEIKSMRDDDQKLRRKWAKMTKKGKTESKKYKSLTEKLVAKDVSNTERMKEIISQYGWPTYDLVGQGGSNSAWLLVQHADRDPLFQMKCLPFLKTAVDEGQANPSNYAYLYDRVQVAKGDKQLYATQSTTNNGIKEGSFQPIEDEANVQIRRAEMGIGHHIEDYARELGFDYRVPTESEAAERAQSHQKSYDEYISRAEEAMESKDYELAITHYLVALESNGSIQPADFAQTARAISLAEHKNGSWAAYYLIQAAINGWEGVSDVDTDEDFTYLKEASARNWKNLLRVIDEVAEIK